MRFKKFLSYLLTFSMLMPIVLNYVTVDVFAADSYIINYYDYTGTNLLYSESVTGGHTSNGYYGDDVNNSSIKPSNETLDDGGILNYEFSHWSVKSDQSIIFEESAIINSDLDLIAVYDTYTTYTIKYYNYDGSKVVYSESVKENAIPNGYKSYALSSSNVAPSDPVAVEGMDDVKEGYIFKHWGLLEDSNVVYDFSKPVTQNISLCAVYEDTLGYLYPVTYWNRVKTSIMYQEYVALDSLVTGYPGNLNTVTETNKDGTGTHVFSHWAYEDQRDTEFDIKNDVITGATDLIPIYNSEYTSINVFYYGYDKTSIWYMQSVTPGDVLGSYNGNNVTSSAPSSYTDVNGVQVKYVFSHWANLHTGEEFDLTQPITTYTELVAVYDEIRTYGVYYWNYDGTVQIYGEGVTGGNTIGTYKGYDLTSTPASPTQPTDGSKYRFSHWINKETGEIFDTSQPVNCNLHLQAVYVLGYTVDYYDTDKTTLLNTEAVADGTSATYIAPTKEYMEFTGWVDASGNLVDLSSVTENTTVYATYALIDGAVQVKFYGVDYLYNTGIETVLDEVIAMSGDSISTDIVVSMPNSEVNGVKIVYTFKGWGTKDGNLVDLTSVTESLDLYPIFDESRTYEIRVYEEKARQTDENEYDFNHYTYYYEDYTSYWLEDGNIINEPVSLDDYTLEYCGDFIMWRKFEGWLYEDGSDFDATKPINSVTYLYPKYTDYKEDFVSKEFKEYIPTADYCYEDGTEIRSIIVGHTWLDKYAYMKLTPTYTYTYADGSTKEFTGKSFVIDDVELVTEGTVTEAVYNSFKVRGVYEGVTYEDGDTIQTYNRSSVISSLSNITITKNPDKMDYLYGEDVDLTGLEVTAKYYYSRYYTPNEDYTDATLETYVYKDVVLSADEYSVTANSNPYYLTVSHTYGSTTRTTSLNLSYKYDTALAGFEITTAGHKADYNAGDYFDGQNTVYKIVISNVDTSGAVSSSKNYSGNISTLSSYGTFEFNNGQPLIEGQTEVPVTFTYTTGEVLSQTFDVTVGPEIPKGDGIVATGIINWFDYKLYDNGVLNFSYNGTTQGSIATSYMEYPVDVKKIYVDITGFDGTVPSGAKSFELRHLTRNMPNVEEIEMYYGDTNFTMNCAGLFEGNSNMHTATFSGDGSIIVSQDYTYNSATNYYGMTNMFNGCTSLQTINWGNLDTSLVSGWFNTFNNVGTNYTIDNTQLVIDLSEIDLSSIKSNNGLITNSVAKNVIIKDVAPTTTSGYTSAVLNVVNCSISSLTYENVTTNGNCPAPAVKDSTINTIKYINVKSLGSPNMSRTVNYSDVLGNTDSISVSRLVFDNVTSKDVTFDSVLLGTYLHFLESSMNNLTVVNSTDTMSLYIVGCNITGDVNIDQICSNNYGITNGVVNLSYSKLNNFNINEINATGYVTMDNLLKSCDITGTFNIEDITASYITLNKAFYGTVSSGLDLDIFDDIPIKGALSLSFACSNLGLDSLDLTGWSTDGCTSMVNMFYDTPYYEIIMSGLNTNSVSSFQDMFRRSDVKVLDFSITSIGSSCTTTGMFDLTLLKSIQTPLNLEKTTVELPQPSYVESVGNSGHENLRKYGAVYDYYWSSGVTDPNMITYTYMQENMYMQYGWAVKYVIDGEVQNYYWIPIDGTHVVESLPATIPETTNWSHGIKAGDTISNYHRDGVEIHLGPNYITDAGVKIQTNSVDADSGCLVLYNIKGTFTVNYYDEDKTTLLYTEVLNDGDVPPYKHVYKEPYIDGTNYVISVSNYWNRLSDDSRVEPDDWTLMTQDTNLYVSYKEKALALTDVQYVISGTLNEKHPDTHTNVRVVVTRKDDNTEIFSDVFTSTYNISGLINDVDYTVTYIDEDTQEQLLQLEVNSDLQNLGVRTISRIEGYSYIYNKGAVKKSFILNIDDMSKIKYKGTITYDNGEPLANKTVTLSVGGYKTDGSYDEVTATDTDWKPYVQELPSDWDRTRGPEGVKYYRLNYNDFLILTENFPTTCYFNDKFFLSNDGEAYPYSKYAGMKVSDYINSKIEESGCNGLELGFINNPSTGLQTPIVIECDTASFSWSVKHFKLTDGVSLNAGWVNTSTSYNDTIETIVFDYKNLFGSESENTLRLVHLRALKSVWFSSQITHFPNTVFADNPNLEDVIFMDPENSNLESIPAYFFSTYFYSYYDNFSKISKLYVPTSEEGHVWLTDTNNSYKTLPNLSKLWVNYNNLGTHIDSGIGDATNIDINEYTRPYYGFHNYDFAYDVPTSSGLDMATSFKWSPSIRFDNLYSLYNLTTMFSNNFTTAGYSEGNGFVSGGSLDYVYFGNPKLTGDATSSFSYINAKDIYMNVLYDDVTHTSASSSGSQISSMYYAYLNWPNTNFHFAYTIDYDLDGGYSNQVLPSRYIEGWVEDGYIVIPNPHKEGYSFAGWEVSGADSAKITQYETYSVLRQDRSSGNMLLKAKWVDSIPNPKIYTVTTDESGNYEFDIIIKNDDLSYLTFTDEMGEVQASVSVDEFNASDTTSMQVLSKRDDVTLTQSYVATSVKLDTYAINLTLPAPTVVSKTLDHIEIVTPPNDVDYFVGEIFDPTGMVVDATYEVVWSDDTITYEIVENVQYDYDNKSELELSVENIVVSFTDTGVTKVDLQPINVNDILPISKTLDSIIIVTPPDDVEYFEKEIFNPAGMVVDAIYLITYNNGSNSTETVHDVIYDYDLKSELYKDNDTVKVSFTDDGITKYANQPITVSPITSVSRTLKSIEIITPPNKVNYFVGELFDRDGMIVDATYELLWSDGSTTTEVVENIEYDYDLVNPLILTDHKVTVSFTDTGVTAKDYQDISVTSNDVVSKVLDSIEIVTPPDKIKYFEEELFDNTGMVVDATYKVTWKNGNVTYEVLKDVDYVYDLKEPLKVSNNIVTVSYSDNDVTKTDTQPISVVALTYTKTLDSIVIATPPDKVEYLVGEIFDPTGMTVDANYTITWNSGKVSKETVKNVKYDYDLKSELKLLDNKVTVSFTDCGTTKTASQAITVKIGVVKSIKGKITTNGKPLANAMITLHSDPITAYTDAEGNYEFKNVTIEEHTLTIYNGSAIAAKLLVDVSVDTSTSEGVFTILQSENSTVATKSEDNTYTVDCDIVIPKEDDSIHIYSTVTVNGEDTGDFSLSLQTPNENIKYDSSSYESSNFEFTTKSRGKNTLSLTYKDKSVASIGIDTTAGLAVDSVFSIIEKESVDVYWERKSENNYVVNFNIIIVPDEPDLPTEPEPDLPTPVTPPATGDNSPIGLLIIMLVLSTCTLAYLYKSKNSNFR